MSKENLERKSARELHGDFAGSYGEYHGLSEYFKVARNILSVGEMVQRRGLKMLDMPSMRDEDKPWVIYKDGQTFGESLGFWEFDDGIWIAGADLDRFEQEVGIPINMEGAVG